MQIKMHYLYNEPSSSSSPSPDLCWVFLRRAAPGCGSRSRVSPPGRPHKFHKPSPAQTAPGKSTMALGHLTKGASWEELIQACLQSFGKSALTCFGTFSFTWWDIAVRSAAEVAASEQELFLWHLTWLWFHQKSRFAEHFPGFRDKWQLWMLKAALCRFLTLKWEFHGHFYDLLTCNGENAPPPLLVLAG